MSPEELAVRCPTLYHVTTPGAWQTTKLHGLLTTTHILDLFQVETTVRADLETRSRRSEVALTHAQYGQIILNDNRPLSESALLKCLDDDLTAAQWLQMLNARVFFWPNPKALQNHLHAKLNRQRTREVIVIDTLEFAKAHAKRIELSPINSGATLRKAARRGLKTFTPLERYSFREWRRLRQGYDNIREIAVRGSIIDIARYVVDVYRTDATKPSTSTD